MISKELQDFLTAYLGIDEDLEETAHIMRGEAGAHISRWLGPQLDAAIRDQAISPEMADYLMSRRFEDETAVANWLAELRREWFG
jgi:hypothetical protein